MKNLSSFCVALVSMFLLNSCIQDDSYDINSIDSSIGITLDDLKIPPSNTSKIYLSEILKLNDSKTVVFDADSNYIFKQGGQYVVPKRPSIKSFVISQKSCVGNEVELNFPTISSGVKRKVAPSVTGNDKIRLFDYEAETPHGIDQLNYVVTNTPVKLTLKFPEGINSVVSVADQIDFTVPQYMTLSNARSEGNTVEQNGNVITVKNASTAKNLVVNAEITKLEFGKEATASDYLTLDKKHVAMKGDIIVDFHASNVVETNVAAFMAKHNGKPVLKSELLMEDFNVIAAEGYFSPDIDMETIGNVEFYDVPDFLTNKGVVVDVDNIKIFVDIDNDMQIEGFINGIINSSKDGVSISRVVVPEVKVNAASTTHICICRKITDDIKDKYTCVEVPMLSNLIRTIPDQISFDVNARANNEKLGFVELGHEYTIAPHYSVEAAVAFGEEANIVYEKEYNGWNADMGDIELKKDATIGISSKVYNTIPLNLKVIATPIDKNGKEITGVTINTEEVFVPASTDGKTPTESEIKINISNSTNDLLRNLDGIKLAITGSAKDNEGNTVTGITLNGKDHYIELRDVLINVKGQIIVKEDEGVKDFN